MSSNIAIKVENLSKFYQIYDQPHDRLKQFILPRLQGMVGWQPEQYFREFRALKDVSFEVKKGETVGIIGRNGSGKSTLLQMICGTLNPTGGSIQTHGRIAALLELGSGFNPEFTGRENVYMNAAVLGLHREEIDERFDDIAAFADIGDFIEQPSKTYSSGMMVRLAFAVAISVDPDILIVDEALAVGDGPFQRKCYSRIEEIKNNGASILFVTHSTQTVIEICNRAILMNQGAILFDGDSHRAVNSYYQLNSSNQLSRFTPFVDNNPNCLDVGQYEDQIPKALVDLASSQDENLGIDASLTSLTAHEIHNKEFGVLIKLISLVTINNEPTNLLRHNGKYKVIFDISFAKILPNISYQVLFKTTNGLPISGNKFYFDSISRVALNDLPKQHIEYEFTCNFVPGLYFISIEVCAGYGVENSVCHKFAEVITFRVLADDVTLLGYLSVLPVIRLRGVNE
jgi:lipopolysaccharide transport system ATP-binding protein